MKPPWIDLLFLHGHVSHRDLPWRKDASAPVRPIGHETRTVADKPRVDVQMRCVLVWPRIVRPR